MITRRSDPIGRSVGSSPAFQRFVSQDPDLPLSWRLVAHSPTGFTGHNENLYAYVLNSPVNLTDPKGLNPFTGWVLIDPGTGGGCSGSSLSFGLCTATFVVITAPAAGCLRRLRAAYALVVLCRRVHLPLVPIFEGLA